MKKSKIILGCIFSLLSFALTLLIGLPNKVYASEVSDYIEENYSDLVVSNNYLSFEKYLGITNTHYCEVSTGEDNIVIITTENNGDPYSFVFDITSLESGVYTFSFKANTTEYNSNYLFKAGDYLSFRDVITFDHIEGVDTRIRLSGIPYSSDSVIYYDLMLNKGTQALPYEPYITGSMVYNQGYQQGLLENATSVLYKAFNGAGVDLIYNDNVVISDTINLTENDLYLSINNMTNIMTYLNDDETSRKYSLLIDLNSAINNELVVLLNNSILDTSLTLSNSLGGYQESFSRAESSLNTIIANSQGRYYDTIIYNPLYPPDYINFKLNLDLSQLTFQEGYNAGLDAGIYEGFNQGSQEGYYKGYDAGKSDGYNDGYNDGSISNIETNGFKTLFNSILSYPVNLISNVLDFEFMGVNIASLIMFIVSIGIVVFVVKKFW